MKLKKIAAVSLVVILSAACLELGSKFIIIKVLKLVHDSNYTVMNHPVLHHINRPSMKRGQLKDGKIIPFGTNAQSWMEDYDITLEKPAGTFRIFYVGDSTTQGHRDPEKRMTEMVEKELNKRFSSSGVRFEVINTGTGSYSFLIYYMLIKTEILKYSPDLVIIDIDMTDVVNDSYYWKLVVRGDDGDIIAIRPESAERYVMTPEGYRKIKINLNLPKWLTDNSDFFYLIDLGLRSYSVKQAAKNVKGRSNWLLKEWTPEISHNVEESLKVLAMTVNILRQHNVRVMITGVPNYLQYVGVWSDMPHKVLEIFCRRAGVPYLNTYEALKKNIKGTPLEAFYVEKDPTHLNAEGQALWADEQLSFLLDPRNGLLPFSYLNKK